MRTELRSIAIGPSTGRSSRESSPAYRRTFQPVGAASATKRKADAIRRSPARRASRHVRTSATIASSTSPARSVIAARRTRRRSSPRSRPPCATGWTSSTSREAALRPIRARTCSSRRSRTSFAPASSRSSRRATTATSSASELAGSPATAPDAISVGAVANAHVFGSSLSVVSPSGLPRMPFAPTDTIPPSWTSTNQRLVDVGSIAGVSRQLCDAAPAGSLQGAIAPRQPRRLPYGVKAAASARRRGQGHRDRREPSWRSDVRVHQRAVGRDDLGSRRLADPLCCRRCWRRCHRPLLE